MKILVAGDFVPRFRVASRIVKNDYGFMDNVKPIIQEVDYAIVNFESPVVFCDAELIHKTGPNLKCTINAMECVSRVGFNCVTLANNHFRDYGQVGVEDTLSSCTKYGVDYVGGGINLQEAESVLYKNINAETIAIINVCENEWSIATNNHGGSCGMNIIDVCHRIKEAKAHAGFVLLIIHGGIEHYSYPTPEMKMLYRFFAEMGANAIVNHHQHCYSGFEVYQGTPIFYGIGNFCFDTEKQTDSWSSGYMVSIDTRNNEFELYPYLQATHESEDVSLIKDQRQFYDSIKKMNEIINDDEKLSAEYDLLIAKSKPLWKSLLNPYQSRFLNKLARWGLLPSFIDERRRNRLYNIVLCESHRGRLLHSLTQDLNKRK